MITAFWSVLEHHALAIRPICDKMKAQGKDVVDLLNHPVEELLSYPCIVSSTAPNIPLSKRGNTIYHFHSLGPFHANPAEEDHAYIPFFKGVMFPGKWWVSGWKQLPEYWDVIGWPKTDLLQKSQKRGRNFRGRTVLYASGMHNYDRLQTLKLLVALSKKLDFTLLIKSHGGRVRWYPKLIKAMHEVTDGSPALWLDPLGDVVDSFWRADVLVSQSSGSMWEFLVTGRSAIQVGRNRLFPGGVIKATLGTLPEVLEGCLAYPYSRTFSEWKDRMAWRDKVIGKMDGKATDRAITFIEEVFSEQANCPGYGLECGSVRISSPSSSAQVRR